MIYMNKLFVIVLNKVSTEYEEIFKEHTGCDIAHQEWCYNVYTQTCLALHRLSIHD